MRFIIKEANSLRYATRAMTFDDCRSEGLQFKIAISFLLKHNIKPSELYIDNEFNSIYVPNYNVEDWFE